MDKCLAIWVFIYDIVSLAILCIMKKLIIDGVIVVHAENHKANMVRQHAYLLLCVVLYISKVTLSFYALGAFPIFANAENGLAFLAFLPYNAVYAWNCADVILYFTVLEGQPLKRRIYDE